MVDFISLFFVVQSLSTILFVWGGGGGVVHVLGCGAWA